MHVYCASHLTTIWESIARGGADIPISGADMSIVHVKYFCSYDIIHHMVFLTISLFDNATWIATFWDSAELGYRKQVKHQFKGLERWKRKLELSDLASVDHSVDSASVHGVMCLQSRCLNGEVITWMQQITQLQWSLWILWGLTRQNERANGKQASSCTGWLVFNRYQNILMIGNKQHEINQWQHNIYINTCR